MVDNDICVFSISYIYIHIYICITIYKYQISCIQINNPWLEKPPGRCRWNQLGRGSSSLGPRFGKRFLNFLHSGAKLVYFTGVSCFQRVRKELQTLAPGENLRPPAGTPNITSYLDVKQDAEGFFFPQSLKRYVELCVDVVSVCAPSGLECRSKARGRSM